MECIILAAGYSQRMGQWKPLLPYQNGCILDAAIQNARKYCHRILLVIGYRGDELIEKYQQNKDILIIKNIHFEQGMFSSIQCAVPYIQGSHFFITLGDMPCIDPIVYKTLLTNSLSEMEILFPGTLEHSGHPVLFPRSVIPYIINAPKQAKMKPLLNTQFPFRFLNVNPNLGILLDVDTIHDYNKLLTLKNHS